MYWWNWDFFDTFTGEKELLLCYYKYRNINVLILHKPSIFAEMYSQGDRTSPHAYNDSAQVLELDKKVEYVYQQGSMFNTYLVMCDSLSEKRYSYGIIRLYTVLIICSSPDFYYILKTILYFQLVALHSACGPVLPSPDVLLFALSLSYYFVDYAWSAKTWKNCYYCFKFHNSLREKQGPSIKHSIAKTFPQQK